MQKKQASARRDQEERGPEATSRGGTPASPSPLISRAASTATGQGGTPGDGPCRWKGKQVRAFLGKSSSTVLTGEQDFLEKRG